jgi:hypothetical protein
VTPVLIYGLLCRVEAGGGGGEINCSIMIYRFASSDKSSGCITRDRHGIVGWNKVNVVAD